MGYVDLMTIIKKFIARGIGIVDFGVGASIILGACGVNQLFWRCADLGFFELTENLAGADFYLPI